MNRELAVAINTFGETLQQLGISGRERGLREPGELGRRAALLAAADLVWRRELGRLLTRAEAQKLLNLGSRQAISDLVKRNRLLALPTQRGTYEYPAFQFDVERGRIHPVVPRLLKTLGAAFVSPFSIASWFTSPNSLLGGSTPAEWIHTGEPEAPLIEAAERTASRVS
jgi:hypothetical protein